MKTIKRATLPFTFIAAILLGGCVGAEPGEGLDTMIEAKSGDGTEMTTEAEPTAEVGEALLSSWDEQMYTDDSFPGGRVRFETIGDIVEVCDIQADGKGVDFWVDGWYYVRVGGSGNCVTKRASMGGVYDLPEGYVYRFVICLNGGWCDEAFWRNNNR